MADEEAKKIAMNRIGRALKTVTPEESEYLKELQGQIAEAMKADPSLDKQMEFCYGIIFAPDKIKNETLIKAARDYINAAQS